MVADELPGFVADSAGFDRLAVPFFAEHCLRCHGPDVAEGVLRVDTGLSSAFDDRSVREHWREVVNVLNGHEMPPEDQPQPDAESVAQLVDWITGEIAREEQLRRNAKVVLRRLNRQEYRNTIRDLVGVAYDTGHFPQDATAGGFDNVGAALTVSPLHLELYFSAAREILDAAIVTGTQPPMIRWRFQPESGDSDSNRVEYDGQRLIVNAGKNRVVRDRIVMHHASWDRTFNVRDFRVKDAGKYVIRIRAGSRIPDRDEVVASAKRFLDERLESAAKDAPDQLPWKQKQYAKDLEHFRTFRPYDYGPARLRVTLHLAGQPQVIGEFDVDASVDAMKTFEIATDVSTVRAGITLEYAYDVPRELENFWMQNRDGFARPEVWIDWMELEGPVYPEWPPESHRRILLDEHGDLETVDQRARARTILAGFMRRAWRRRVSEKEVEEKLALFDLALQESSSLAEAIQVPLTAVLVSPSFLFFSEPLSDREDHRLNDFQMASRLSGFLWSSMPDERLFQLAEQGRLREASVVQEEVKRMLDDPKSEAFVENFASQWLGLREIGSNPPAPDLYRRYDRHLEISMIRESLAFFREILKNDLSVMNFVDSDFVMINERLARFYGIDGVRGDAMRRVEIAPDIHRGGLMTQASMLSVTSNGTRTSPVRRGTWILKNMLGRDPGLPVANAGEIAPQVPGIDKATVRQRLAIHRELPQCARCHNKIDPLGLVLENFDASGAWREREGHGYQGRIGDNDPVIDASAQLPDGTRIDGVGSLKTVLADQQDLFLTCLAEKMFQYALGREMGVTDRSTIRKAVEHLKTNDLTLRSLIQFIVASDAFVSR